MGDNPPTQVTEQKTEEGKFPHLAKLFSNQPISMTPEQFASLQSDNVKAIEKLADTISVRFTESLKALAPKQEATPSSPAAGGSGSGQDLKKIAEYFMSNGQIGEGRWSLNKEEYIDKWWKHYTNTVYKNREAVTSTNTPGITFDREVLLIPGGQSIVNIRPYVNFKQVPDDSDTFHWHTLGKVTFGAITAGSATSAASQTLSRVAGTVTERGALQKVSFLQTKTLPVDLVNSVSDTMVAAALHDEAALVLEEAATATGGDITAAHWIKGSDGSEITSDDTASVTLQFDGINAALRLLETQGYRRQEATAFLHPRQHAELLSDLIETQNVNASEFNSPLMVNGVVERFLGCRVVVTPAVYTKDNATQDALRAIVTVPQALGLASKGSVELESQRFVDVSQIYVSGRHYVDAAVIDSTGYVRISTSAS